MAYRDNHFSPVLANKWWANHEGKYTSYYRDHREGRVRTRTRGKRQWGKGQRLWPRDVELSLNRELEDPIAPIYRNIMRGIAPGRRDRTKWAQFLLSQVVRTPTFMRYERGAQELSGVGGRPIHDRVGCEHCADLLFVTARRWCLLVAHEDDYFVRTDNPVHLTGFVECNETAIYYPIAPHVCFVACPLVDGDVIAAREQPSIPAWPMEKGGAWMVNFYLAKHADDSIVLRPDQDSETANTMFGEVLGVYPQPPFPLHVPDPEAPADAFESIRLYQSATDGHEYPIWSAEDLERAANGLLQDVTALEAQPPPE